MDTLVAAAAGLDVHKNTVVACVRLADAGCVRLREIRTFRTVAKSLRELRDWLVGHVTDVAIESTGVYWKPVFNILEGAAKVCLVNARHAKGVPGRKTDAKDCEWLADLLAHGLLRASFIPPKVIRDLRELTRQRTQLTAQTAQVANRIHKILEDAGIKLGSVISDVMGKSGRAVIGALAAGEADPAASAGPRMKKKLPAIRESLESPVDDNHRFLLRMLLDEFAMLEAFAERLDQRVEEVSAPFAQEIELLETIPGIAKRAAQNIVAETGGDMKVFPTAGKGVLVGRHVPGQQPQRRQNAGGPDQPRQPLAQDDPGSGGLGGLAHEEHAPVGALPQAVEQARSGKGGGGVGRQVAADNPRDAAEPDALPRFGSAARRRPRPGAAGKELGPPAGEARPQGHAGTGRMTPGRRSDG